MKKKLLFGTAYYYEYLPCERMEEDFRMMKKAGFNMIRIAESTWSTWEPSDGNFDFSKLHAVLEAAGRYDMQVIVGTPTYAIPPWLAKKYPDILSDTHNGPCRYGSRQNFDLTHPGYRFHAERIIRKLMEQVQNYSCVIGFQLDNETKPYDTCSPRAQELFKKWLKERFATVNDLNEEMGFAYWSNSISDWEELPDVRGTINASFGGEYQAFQRHLVTEFLSWQRSIVEEYRRPDQFVTHNFDGEWRLYTFGLQPEVNQFDAAKALTVAGFDIYHPSEHQLTGEEISFSGAMARGLKQNNYLVLETEAQGNFGWLPYPGQLYLQAFSHLANGADCVSYWHWHSIHNAVESYWKGVLSHDFSEGAVYQEAAAIGRDFARLSDKLIHLKKENKIAVMVSSRSQTGFQWFPTCQQGGVPEHSYSDYLRWICDALYHLNLEYDIINDDCDYLGDYSLILLPGLYSASEQLLDSIRRFVAAGGHLIGTFRTGFANEYLKIYYDAQPHGLTECFGITYDRFTKPVNVKIKPCRNLFDAGTSTNNTDTVLPDSTGDFSETLGLAQDWMELLSVKTAEILCTYRHPAWNDIPAVTRNHYGKGQAIYLGCCMEKGMLEKLLCRVLPDMGITLPELHFPVIVRTGKNMQGKTIKYYLNYSGEVQIVPALEQSGLELLSDTLIKKGCSLTLQPWEVKIIEQ